MNVTFVRASHCHEITVEMGLGKGAFVHIVTYNHFPHEFDQSAGRADNKSGVWDMLGE